MRFVNQSGGNQNFVRGIICNAADKFNIITYFITEIIHAMPFGMA